MRSMRRIASDRLTKLHTTHKRDITVNQPLYDIPLKRLDGRPLTLAEYKLLPKHDSDVLWNFEKFLVGRDGRIINRFAPDVTPDDRLLIAAIEAALS